MLGCPANKALITGINPVVSAFLIAVNARLWVPAVNILFKTKWTRIGPFLLEFTFTIKRTKTGPWRVYGKSKNKK